MKKVQIFAYELGYGGIEQEIITLANSLINLYDIELVFVFDNNSNYDINKKIKITSFYKNKGTSRMNLFKFRTEMKKCLQEFGADIIISTDVVFNNYILKGNSAKKIFWEHRRLSTIKKKMPDLKGFESVVVLDSDVYNLYTNVCSKTVIIPNFIDCVPDISSSHDTKNIVCVGKLTEEKGYEQLINVMESVYQKDMDIKLYIVGEGEERFNLEKLVRDKHLNYNVVFYGSLTKTELEKVFLDCSLFVTCTHEEAFGLSIISAMSYALPVIAFNDVNCFRQIIKNEIDGYLIDKRDEILMSNKIIELMSNKEALEQLGNCAKESVLVYDINSIKGEWIKIL